MFFRPKYVKIDKIYSDNKILNFENFLIYRFSKDCTSGIAKEASSKMFITVTTNNILRNIKVKIITK